jgi:hypothetical protein
MVMFFGGGWVAGRTSGAWGRMVGFFNGTMAGITTIVLMLVIIGAGLGYLFGALTSNLQFTAILGQALIAGEFEAGTAEAAARDIKAGTWITFATLLFALLASGVGGWIGGQTTGEVEQIDVRRPIEA